MSTPRDVKKLQLVRSAMSQLEIGGPSSVQVRTVGAKHGMTSQSVFTLFGGLPGLMTEVAAVGFTDLAEDLAAVLSTADPTADLFTTLITYAGWGMDHPELYRLMFGITDPLRSSNLKSEPRSAIADLTERAAVFAIITAAVTQMISAGRIGRQKPLHITGQVFSAVHGWTLLQTSGEFGPAEGAGLGLLGDLLVALAVGLGDDDTSARASLESTIFFKPKRRTPAR